MLTDIIKLTLFYSFILCSLTLVHELGHTFGLLVVNHFKIPPNLRIRIFGLFGNTESDLFSTLNLKQIRFVSILGYVFELIYVTTILNFILKLYIITAIIILLFLMVIQSKDLKYFVYPYKYKYTYKPKRNNGTLDVLLFLLVSLILTLVDILVVLYHP